MLTDPEQHPLYRHVRSWRDAGGTSWWGLAGRTMLWSKQARFREDALRAFLSGMTAHEIIALTRKLEAENPSHAD